MVINGLPQTVKTSGDNKTRLLETTVNANIDNVRPKILDYFVKREEKGLQGKITFLIGEDVGINFEDEINKLLNYLNLKFEQSIYNFNKTNIIKLFVKIRFLVILKIK